MKKIALEEHFITPDFMAYTQRDFDHMRKDQVETFKKTLLDVDEERLEAMDKGGIDISVLSMTAPGVQVEKEPKLAIKNARIANDTLAATIARHPTRYLGFAHLPMQDAAAAVKELDYAICTLKFVGALINDQTNGLYLDDPQYLPFWEKVEELNVPIYLHPSDPYDTPHNYQGHAELKSALWGWTVETATHALRLICSGLFDRFPKAKVILGHMGETLPYLLWRFDSRWQIMKSDIQLNHLPSHYLKNNFFITTSGMCSNGPLLCAIQELGAERVMFSVDYPYESTPVATSFIDNAPLADAVKAKVCYQNAALLLKINLETYSHP